MSSKPSRSSRKIHHFLLSKCHGPGSGEAGIHYYDSSSNCTYHIKNRGVGQSGLGGGAGGRIIIKAPSATAPPAANYIGGIGGACGGCNPGNPGSPGAYHFIPGP